MEWNGQLQRHQALEINIIIFPNLFSDFFEMRSKEEVRNKMNKFAQYLRLNVASSVVERRYKDQ